MKNKCVFVAMALALGLLGIGVGYASLRTTTANIVLSPDATYLNNLAADNPAPPATPVKLIFIHHSTGGHWLADVSEHDNAGGLAQALTNNNYFVSATNYEWGPDNIGDRTDIPNWPEWFTDTIMSAVYAETGQNIGGFGDWTRMADPNPSGENEIIMFKSCFPNSDLYGNPGDLPLPEPNDYEYTVANAKAVYNKILTYFAAHQDKLFIVITAPPLAEGETAPERATNARAFNNWLINDWLSSNSYTHSNVAVFDYYNVLTSNGSPGRIDDTEVITEPNDYALRPDGNHHYWNGSAVAHTQTIPNNYSAYPSGDSHPTTNGQQKATAEFVPLLNVFYNRWKSGTTPTPPTLHLTRPNGGENWLVGSQQMIQWTTTGTIANVNLYYSTDSFATRRDIVLNLSNTNSYNWTTPVTTSTTTLVRVESVISPTTVFDVSDAFFTLYQPGEMDYFIYLPLVLRNYSGTTPPIGDLIQPADLVYLGAFRLPDDGERPNTFEYGGNAVTFNPDGDPSNTDAHAGSLFITGHDRLPYGELLDGDQVAEVNIPVPSIAISPTDLPQASFIQTFCDVSAGYFTNLEDIPKVGMQYLNHAGTGPLIHLCWGQHIQPPDEPSHAWFSPNLTAPNLQGVWFIGYQNLYSTNGYMLDIPPAWADSYVEGRYLATGRMRDGGQGGMGPTLFAYRPWLDGGAAPVSGTHLAETTLLLYENADATEEITRCLNSYQHPDEWEGGAWLTTSFGKSAVLFAGTKSNGTKYWYGYINPAGPEFPCVDANITDFPTCRLADGSLCPEEDMAGCCDENAETCISLRGWWTTHFDAEFILYDPADLARVAAGEIESWEPQPYTAVDIDKHLYLDPPEWDEVNLGWGSQRRYRIGDATFDRENGFLYVLELYADGAKPVVHVWHVQ